MSTRIFASFLRANGVPARQFDAPEMGVVTSDDFGNADILYDQTLSKVGADSTATAGTVMLLWLLELLRQLLLACCNLFG
jgi:aspartate kinase